MKRIDYEKLETLLNGILKASSHIEEHWSSGLLDVAPEASDAQKNQIAFDFQNLRELFSDCNCWINYE